MRDQLDKHGSKTPITVLREDMSKQSWAWTTPTPPRVPPRPFQPPDLSKPTSKRDNYFGGERKEQHDPEQGQR